MAGARRPAAAPAEIWPGRAVEAAGEFLSFWDDVLDLSVCRGCGGCGGKCLPRNGVAVGSTYCLYL